MKSKINIDYSTISLVCNNIIYLLSNNLSYNSAHVLEKRYVMFLENLIEGIIETLSYGFQNGVAGGFLTKVIEIIDDNKNKFIILKIKKSKEIFITYNNFEEYRKYQKRYMNKLLTLIKNFRLGKDIDKQTKQELLKLFKMLDYEFVENVI